MREPLRKVHEGILNLLDSITITDMAEDDADSESGGCGGIEPGEKLYSVETEVPASLKS